MASAEYVISIATSMPEGAKTLAQLDDLTASLLGGGKGAESFSSAMAQVSDKLAQAEQASSLANASLAEGKTKFTELEKAALKAAAAEEKAALKGAVPPEVAAAAMAAKTAVDAYSSKLATLEHNAAKAGASEKDLARQLANVKQLAGHADKAIAGQAERLGKMQGALGAVGGPLGALGQRVLGPVKGFSELSGSIGSANAAALLGVAAFAAVAAAVVAITLAAVAGAVAVAAWAVGLADSARSASLATEAAEALTPGLVELRGDFAALNDQTGASQAELRAWTKQLDAAKVKAEDLPEALRAVALSSAALGQEGVSDFFDQLKAAKGAAGDLSAEVNGKLGGIVAKKMLSLDAQTARLKKNIGSLFGGLNIEPVLSGMQVLVGLFDKSTVAGDAMKFLFESIFQPLINQAENAAYVVEAFALGFLIGLTKVYIAVKPAIKAISDFFGFKDTSLSDVLGVVTKGAEYVAYAFVGFVGVLALVGVAIGTVVAQGFLFLSFIAGLVSAVVGAGIAIVGSFLGAWNSVKEFFAGLDLGQIGRDMMTGLANGITGAAGAVIGAITGAVGGAVDTAKKLLGIASPSKVFADIGGNTAEGFAMGVDDGAADAQEALAGLVEPPAPAGINAPGASGGGAGGASGAGGGGRGKGGPQSVVININGVAGAQEAIAQIREAVIQVLEGAATSSSGAAPA